MIHPHLAYAVELYGNATKHCLNPLQILQNKLLRILQRKSPRSPTNSLYADFDTFRIQDLYELNLLKLTHKIIYNPAELPQIFQNYLTFNQDIHAYNTRHKNDIFVHPIKSRFGSKTFKFRSHQPWNSLPESIKETASASQFNRQTKTHYRCKYF